MPRHSLRNFDPNSLAKLDTQMWQAYYSHEFIRLILLIVKMIHSQFGLNWLQSARAAYYSGKAAAGFRRNRYTKKYDKVIHDLNDYYTYIERHAVEKFDPQHAAELELNWWLVHRYPKKYPQTLKQALAESMAVLYDVSPEKLADFAKYSVEAMHIRDVATWETKTEPDWQQIEGLLMKSFTALRQAVN